MSSAFANEIRVIHNFVNWISTSRIPESQPERKDSAAHLELPPGEARAGLHSDPRRSPQGRAAVHLLMAGDGPERGPAEMLARELGVEQDVRSWASRIMSSG